MQRGLSDAYVIIITAVDVLLCLSEGNYAWVLVLMDRRYVIMGSAARARLVSILMIPGFFSLLNQHLST